MKLFRILLASFFVSIIVSCGEKEKKSEKTLSSSDFENIKKRGTLRVLTEKTSCKSLPRAITPHQRELSLLEAFAEKNKLKLRLVEMKDFDELIPALNNGEGDIIAANMTVTKSRKKFVAFTIPVADVTEELVTFSDMPFKSLRDLVMRKIILVKGTCYWKNARKLRRGIPSLILATAPEGYDTMELIELTGDKKIPFTIVDSNYTEAYKKYRNDIKTVYEFPGKRAIAFAVNKSSRELLRELDLFLKSRGPEKSSSNCWKGDLTEIKKKKILRVITRNNPYCYYIHKGSFMGFEYELVKKFAEKHGVKPVMVIPPKWEDMFSWLRQGRGDIIAAAVTITDKRRNIPGLSFQAPYCEITQKLIMRKNDTSIKKLKDLKGREIAVRPESSYLETIHELNRKHKLGIVPLLVPGDMETYEIIRLVSEGKYNYTIADSNILNLECRRISGIKSALDLKEKQHYGWMTRKNDRELEKAVNDFFRKEHKGAFFNIIYRKYFNNPELIKKHKKIFHSVKKGGDLSPYDSIIKKYSSQYGFNWCFIASQVFQESRFKADIRARDGGMGLMQLMPFTAKELDCKDPFNPADNVNAGVKYMCRLKKRVGKRVPHGREANLLCFALASYNGGYGHLLDARKLAEKQKLSPDIWYGNVEEAYKLLSRKKYATRARYGYCNSDIITNYVNDILLRFYHYKQNYPEN